MKNYRKMMLLLLSIAVTSMNVKANNALKLFERVMCTFCGFKFAESMQKDEGGGVYGILMLGILFFRLNSYLGSCSSLQTKKTAEQFIIAFGCLSTGLLFHSIQGVIS